MRYVYALLILSLLAIAACQQVQTQNAPPNANVKRVDPTPVPDEAKRITLKEAKDAYDGGKELFVDTRPLNAYQVEHIKGSISMPAGEVENRIGELPKDTQIIFYCS